MSKASSQSALSFRAFGGIRTDGDVLDRQMAADGVLAANRAVGILVSRDRASFSRLPNFIQLPVNTTASVNGASEPVQALCSFTKKPGNEFVLVAKTPSGYYKSIANGAWSSLKATPGGYGLIPSFSVINDRLHCVDGETSWYWDGETAAPTDLTNYAAPERFSLDISGTVTSFPYVAMGAGGTSLQQGKVYESVFTFYDGTVESPPSRPIRFAIPNSSNRTATVHTGYTQAAAGTAGTAYAYRAVPASTTSIRVYLSAANDPKSDDVAGGAHPWYFVATQAYQAAGTEITYAIAAEATGDTYIEAFYGPPAGTTGIVAHIGKLFCWGSPAFPTRIWWTDALNTLRFYIENFVDIDADNPDDEIRSCVSLPEGLLVLKERTAWLLTGSTGETMSVQELPGAPGCIGVHAARRTPVGTVWSSSDSIHRYGGQGIEDLATGKVRDEYQASVKVQ